MNFIKEMVFYIVVVIAIIFVISLDLDKKFLDFVVSIIVSFTLFYALAKINIDENNNSELEEYLPDEIYQKLVIANNIITYVATIFMIYALYLAFNAFFD